MSRRYAPLLLGPIAAFALLAAAACGDTGEGGEITVTLTDDSLTVAPASVPKGPIEIAIKNEGEKQHSLLIIKTSIPADELPTEEDGSVDTGGADIDVQHEVDEIDDGDDTSRTYEMDPGTYVLISNDVQEENDVKTADYAEGMYASLTVTEDDESPSPSAAGSRTPTNTP
jgi:hypothetical protein